MRLASAELPLPAVVLWIDMEVGVFMVLTLSGVPTQVDDCLMYPLISPAASYFCFRLKSFKYCLLDRLSLSSEYR